MSLIEELEEEYIKSKERFIKINKEIFAVACFRREMDTAKEAIEEIFAVDPENEFATKWSKNIQEFGIEEIMSILKSSC